MTFNFDGGDILVILLVVIVFVLFRRFDRTGRSLEKVRRYADKSKADLDAIVRERELGIKDLAVDLEVQEKTNREILARAEAARDEILSRGEELEGRVERIEAHEKALEELNDLALRVDENLSRLRDESAYVDEVGRRLGDVRDKFTAMEQKDEARFAEFRAAALGEFGSEIESMKSGLGDVERQMTLFRDTLENLNARRDEEVNGKLSAFRDELEAVEEDFRERLRKVAEEGARLEDEAFLALNEKIDARSERLESNWLGGMNDLKERVASTAGEIQDSLGEARIEMERLGTEFRDVDEKLSDTASRLDSNLDEVRGRLERIVDEKETDLLETVEIRQTEYRKTIEERFGRMEGFIEDMDTLAESLRESQKQTLEQVEQAFTEFDSTMSERRDLEKARVEEEAATLRQDMADLERGLDELKSRAYDNVSEKLQVFEDDFFADLKQRDEQMKAAFEEWRRNAELEMNELGLKAAREREETERRYSVELKQKLTDLQTRVFGQFDTFSDQVDGFRESLSGRIQSAEGDLAAFRDTLAERVAKEKEAAFAEFTATFESFDKDVHEKFAKADKTISQKLADYGRDIDSGRREFTEGVQAIREETGEWTDRVRTRMDEALRDSSEAIDSLKADFAAWISELKDEYSGKTEQLVLESGEERAALRREIGSLEEAVAHLSTELTEKTRDSLDTLKDQSEDFLLEFRKNAREARDDVERKIKELRQTVQESREKAESNRKEMAAHTDTEYARLMRNLDEIDKRQREFIAETRVFERADEMKEQLENDIAELSRQLDAVGSGREDVRAMTEQYERAVSLYDEVSGKLARFLSEQQKVENLEGKIARIGSLSESVDLKLARIGEVNDTLQDQQIRLKQLEDLHQDLGARYEKLAEMSTVLDAATDGVDKNYERMSGIEQMIRDLAERLTPLRAELEAAEERQTRLQSDGDKIDAAVEKIGSLDATIAELDRRMEDLGKAREWLARTETRLEEINTETQQQVRLLGTLSKREAGRKTSGSPDMSTREVVVKLAREGWNSEEIARTTKLSRGEVELILELTPNE